MGIKFPQKTFWFARLQCTSAPQHMAYYGILRITKDEESSGVIPAICDGDGLGGDGATHSLNNRDENEEPIEVFYEWYFMINAMIPANRSKKELPR